MVLLAVLAVLELVEATYSGFLGILVSIIECVLYCYALVVIYSLYDKFKTESEQRNSNYNV